MKEEIVRAAIGIGSPLKKVFSKLTSCILNLASLNPPARINEAAINTPRVL